MPKVVSEGEENVEKGTIVDSQKNKKCRVNNLGRGKGSAKKIEHKIEHQKVLAI